MIIVQIIADRGTTLESLVSVKCHKIEPDAILPSNVILHTIEPIPLMFSGSPVLSKRWSVPRVDINDWCEVDKEATENQAKKQEQSRSFERLKQASISRRNMKTTRYEPPPETKPEPKVSDPVEVQSGCRHIDLDLDDD